MQQRLNLRVATLNLIILSTVLFIVTRSNQYMDRIFLNAGNFELLQQWGEFTSVLTIPEVKISSTWVRDRLQRNAEMASIVSQIKNKPAQQSLSQELKTAFSASLPEPITFQELCAHAQLGEDLDRFILPASAQFTQRSLPGHWELKGISQYAETDSSNNSSVVLWWGAKDDKNTHEVPLSDRVSGELCYANGVIGVPVELTVLNSDPQFDKSARIADSELGKDYHEYWKSPYLLDFKPVEAGKPPQDRVNCRTHHSLVITQPQAVELELFSGDEGCYLVAPYPVHSNDILLLITKFKTTEAAQGHIAFYWPGINKGVSVGGSYPSWHTSGLLFDMYPDSPEEGWLLLKTQGDHSGATLLDFVFLARIIN